MLKIERNACILYADYSSWDMVDGYFSGYPLSIEHNSYDTLEEAMQVCAENFDCGGVSRVSI